MGFEPILSAWKAEMLPITPIPHMARAEGFEPPLTVLARPEGFEPPSYAFGERNVTITPRPHAYFFQNN